MSTNKNKKSAVKQNKKQTIAKRRDGPLAKMNKMSLSANSINNSRRQIIRVPYEEVVGTFISTGTGFQYYQPAVLSDQQGFTINPGMSATFARLSTEAILYEKYRFVSFEAFTVPMGSEFSDQGKQGQALLYLEYDAASAAPQTSRILLESSPSDSNLTCNRVRIVGDPNQMGEGGANGWKYVRNAHASGKTDIREYDAAVLYIASEGVSNTANWGRVMIKGVVEFQTRVLPTNFNLGAAVPILVPNYTISQYYQAAPTNLVNGAATDVVWAIGANALGLSPSAGSVSIIFLPSGNYLVFYQIQLVLSVTAGNSISTAIAALDSPAGIYSDTSWTQTSVGAVGPDSLALYGLAHIRTYAGDTTNNTVSLNVTLSSYLANGGIADRGYLVIMCV